jgi:FAD/FMN-containing dehydrogenase
MNKIIKINEEALTATAQPGINGQQLQWEMNKKGTNTGDF